MDEYYYRLDYRGGFDLQRYRVIKHTPCGVVLDVYGQRRFVMKNSRKCFAHDTIERATESFLARKKRQISILKAQIANAEEAIERIKLGDSVEKDTILYD